MENKKTVYNRYLAQIPEDLQGLKDQNYHQSEVQQSNYIKKEKTVNEHV